MINFKQAIISLAGMCLLVGCVDDDNYTNNYYSSGSSAAAYRTEVTDVNSGYNSDYNKRPARNRNAQYSSDQTRARNNNSYSSDATPPEPVPVRRSGYTSAQNQVEQSTEVTETSGYSSGYSH